MTALDFFDHHEWLFALVVLCGTAVAMMVIAAMVYEPNKQPPPAKAKPSDLKPE